MDIHEIERRDFLKLAGSGLAATLMPTGISMAGEAAAESFTIVVLPDTQLYSLNYPQTFIRQTEWIKEQKDALDIACVIHVGDITHRNSEAEWKVAYGAMRILDNVVPYFMVMGNHDLGPGGTAENRNSDLFNKYFGPQHFDGKPCYGGHYGEGNENAYYFLQAGGMEFLIVCLEFGPRDEVLQWANEIVEMHKHLRTIVVTHCYTYSDNTRVGDGDDWNPHIYGVNGNDGDEVWDKFVKKHENIFLVLSGHILHDGLGRLASTGDHGNQVHQVLANYQMKENGGNGWLRIMRFRPTQNKIEFSTYSPVLDKFAEDDQNKFEVDYRQTLPPE